MRGALCARPRLVRACARAAGFSLLELMVVIGILGVLTAVLLGQFGGATESARATECLTHMRNLASAVQNYCMAQNYYPCAGDVEYITSDMRYKHHKGFITRYSASGDPYSRKNGAASHQSLQTVSTYCEDDEASLYCVTNGAIWTYGARKLDEFICPSHRRLVNSMNSVAGPGWSYVMNPYFGYDYSSGSESTGGPDPEIKYGTCKRPDKRLLFAELQWEEDATEIKPVFDKSPSTRMDGVLQYDRSDWSGTKEAIGYNHKVGTKYVAHVCFADGHTEKLALGGASSGQLVELTKWLCDSDDITFSGGQWRRTHKASDED